MPPSGRPEDASEDAFLRDPEALEGFREKVGAEPSEGGAPEPEAGPGEVSVEVEQTRFDGATADDGDEAEDGFWGRGFRPATGSAGDGELAGAGSGPAADADEGEDEAGDLGEKLDALDLVDISEA